MSKVLVPLLGATLVALAAWLAGPFSETYVVRNSGIVVITGCSSGIGRDAAMFLAEKGYHVFATVRKSKDLDSLTAEAVSSGVEKFMHPLVADVTGADAVASLQNAVERFSEQTSPALPLVGVINNAGIQGDYNLVEKVSVEEIKKVLDVNVFAALHVTQSFMPLLRKHKGRVINVGSMAGVIARPFNIAYTMSKFAMEALSDTLRLEMRAEKTGVAVVMVNPGVVESAIHGKQGTAASAADWSEEQKIALEARKLKAESMISRLAYAPRESTSPDILKALTAASPKARYYQGGATAVTGADTTRWIFGVLPDSVRDFLTVKSYEKK